MKHRNKRIKQILTKKFLIRECIDREKSQLQISKELKCSRSTLNRALKSFNIKIRQKNHLKWNKILTKKVLKREYLNKTKSCQQIGNYFNCNAEFIRKYLKKYNIPRRTRIELSKGTNNPNHKGDKAIYRQKYYCKEVHCNNKIKYGNWKYGQRRCPSCAMKKLWKNKNFRKKIIKSSLKASLTSPNKPEKQLNKFLQKILPNKYKFVGNGKIVIDRYCPDFVNCNGQKKIIEMYGDYWHNLEKHKKIDKNRIKIYAKYGYKTLIIWEHELKDLEKVKDKVLNFNGGN